MGRTSDLTPKQIRQIRTDRAAGLSLRDTGARAGVSHQAVKRLEERTASVGGAPRRSKRAASTALPTVEEMMATPLPTTGDPEAIAELKVRAARVRALLERLTPLVEVQEFPATQYVTIARYGDDIARLLAELTPPPPPNLDEDAATIEAERILLARIEGMVLEEEARR